MDAAWNSEARRQYEVACHIKTMRDNFTRKTSLDESTDKLPIVHFTNLGFDADGFLAQFILASSGRLAACVTTGYKPEEKAALSRKFLQCLVAKGLIPESAAGSTDKIWNRVFQGEGYYENPKWNPDKRREAFAEVYPRFPKEMGDVGLDLDETCDCIFPHQTTSFEKLGLELVPGDSQIDSVIEMLKSTEGQVVFVSTGPPINEAELFRREPDLMLKKVAAIYMTSGTLVDPRFMTLVDSFNKGVNPEATQIILGSGIPCIMTPPELAESIYINGKMMNPIFNVKYLYGDEADPLGAAIIGIMQNSVAHRNKQEKHKYANNKTIIIGYQNPNPQPPGIGKALTAHVALHPESLNDISHLKHSWPPGSADPNDRVFEVHVLENRKTLGVKLAEQMLPIFQAQVGRAVKAKAVGTVEGGDTENKKTTTTEVT